MDSLKRLEEFEAVSQECRKIGAYIRKQEPYLYEEEYGVDLLHYSDEDLMDLFIRKFGHYKPSVMSVVFGKYRRFYEWCLEKQYISWNPFDNSKFLSYEYLVRMAAANGNVPYYSRDYVVQLCEGQDGAADYYKAIALSLFEGVKSYSQLARLEWADFDRERRLLSLEGRKISVSQELAEAYQRLREDGYFQAGDRRMALDQDSGALILPLIRYGQQHSLSRENYRYLSNAMSRKMKALGLSASGLYESGIMHCLVQRFGKEAVLGYLLPDQPVEKAVMTRKNRELEAFFKEHGISLTGRDFSFDFKGYGLLLKYGGILEKNG